MAKLNDISSKAVREALGAMCVGAGTKPILAINAASAATVKTTNALTFSVDGVLYSKAALAAQVLTVKDTLQKAVTGRSVFYVQPANTTVYYVLCIDAAGNVYTVQGTYDGQALLMPDTNMPVTGKGGVPDVDTSTYAVIGMIKIALGATTFTVGTTALDAANVTATYFDLVRLPSTNP